MWPSPSADPYPPVCPPARPPLLTSHSSLVQSGLVRRLFLATKLTMMQTCEDDLKSPDMSEVSQQVQVEVLDYSIEGDKDVLQNHEFTLEVKLSAKSANIYTIRRSFVSFCNLDAKLRRIFPKSNIYPLPHPAAMGSGRRKSVPSPPSPESTVGALTEYVQSILGTPEVLKSTELWNFLDFEYADGTPSPSAAASVADVILVDAETTSKTVGREHRVSLEAHAYEYIAWSFSTKSKDIGFRVVQKGSDLVAYQRYNSHAAAATGIAEIPQNGVVELVWDNSYSKWRSKALTYACRVIPLAEVESASSIAVSAIRQSVMYNKTRSSLKRCLLLQAADMKDGKSDNLLQGLSVEEIRFLRLEQQLDDLSDQKSILEFDLSECVTMLGEKTVEAQRLNSELESMTDERNALSQQLAATELLHQSQLTRAEEAEAQIVSMADDIAAVHLVQAENRELTDRVKTLEANSEALQQTLQETRGQLDRATKAALTLQTVFLEDVQSALNGAALACQSSEVREAELRAQLKSVRQVCSATVVLHEEMTLKLKDMLGSLQEFQPALRSAADGPHFQSLSDGRQRDVEVGATVVHSPNDLKQAVISIDMSIQAVIRTLDCAWVPES